MSSQEENRQDEQSDEILLSFMSDGTNMNTIDVKQLVKFETARYFFQYQIKDQKFNLQKMPKIQPSFMNTIQQILDQSRMNCISCIDSFPEEYKNEFYFRRQVQIQHQFMQQTECQFFAYSEQDFEEIEVSNSSDSGAVYETQSTKTPTKPFVYKLSQNIQTLITNFLNAKAKKSNQKIIRSFNLIDQNIYKNVLFLHDFYQTPIDLLLQAFSFYENGINIAAPFIADIIALTHNVEIQNMLPFIIDFLARYVRMVFMRKKYCIICHGTSTAFAISLQKFDRLCQKIIVCNPIGNISLDIIKRKEKVRRNSSSSVHDQNQQTTVSDKSYEDTTEQFGPATQQLLEQEQKIKSVAAQLNEVGNTKKQSDKEAKNSSDHSEISETVTSARRFSTSIEIIKKPSSLNLQQDEQNALTQKNRMQNLTAHYAMQSISRDVSMKKDAQFMLKKNFLAKQNKELIESINNVLINVYTDDIAYMLIEKLQLQQGMKLIYSSNGFKEDFAKIYKNFKMQFKRVQAFKSLLFSLHIFSPLDTTVLYDQLIDNYFFEMMYELTYTCDQEVKVHPNQEIYFFVSDHSPLMNNQMLQMLNDMEKKAVNVMVKTIYGCGHDMYQLSLPFLIQIIKSIFSDA